MPIRVKNPKTESLAKDLELSDRLGAAGEVRPLALEIEEIVERYSRLPLISNLTDDEILGYDEFGIPSDIRRAT